MPNGRKSLISLPETAAAGKLKEALTIALDDAYRQGYGRGFTDGHEAGQRADKCPYCKAMDGAHTPECATVAL